MGSFGDLAFAAVDNFLKTEIRKKIQEFLSEESCLRLIRMMKDSQRRGAELAVEGKVKASIRDLVVEYTGTAMRKTSERTVKIEDQMLEFSVRETLPSPGPMREGDTIPDQGPSAQIRFSLDPVLDNINHEEGMGGLKARIRKISFRGEAEVTLSSEYKSC